MTTTSATDLRPYEPFIAARLPIWLREASSHDRAQLEALSVAAEQARDALKTATDALPSLHAFACKRLREDLQQALGTSVDPTQAVFYWVDPEGKRPPLQHTLLEAALINFHRQEAVASAFGPGSGLFAAITADGQPDTTHALALTPEQFATRCRFLDIGGQFQRALAEHVPASLPNRSPVTAQIPLSWRVFDTQHKLFKADTWVASLKGNLGSAGRALLANWNLIAAAPTRTPAQAYRLELLGFPLSQVLVFTAQFPASDHQAVVAYLPGDAEGSVREYPSAQAMVSAWGQKLQASAFQALLSQFVPLSRRLDFMAALNLALVPGNWLPSHLTWTPIPVAGDPFLEHYRIWAQQTLADAAVLAVPTGTIDHQDAVERYARWVQLGEQLGLTLALMVGSSIPGINIIVDGIVLAQAVHNVYEGVQAWRQGDKQAALENLFGAIENTAFFGLGKRPQPTPATAAFADKLIPVTGDDGQVRLWRPDLDDFSARDLPPKTVKPDPAGFYHHRGRAWVRLEGQFHEVAADATPMRAQLLHSEARSYRPVLHSSGNGNWRTTYENPAVWQRLRLIKRFSHRYDSVPADVVVQAQRLSGISEGQLRAAHLDGKAMPAPLAWLLDQRLAERQLASAVQALRTTRRLPGLPAVLVETLRTLPGWPQDYALAYQHEQGVQTFGPSEPARVIHLDQPSLENGGWAARLIAQLDFRTKDALLGAHTSLVPAEFAHATVAERWATTLQNRHNELIHRLAEPAARAEPGWQALQRQFPGLPVRFLSALMEGRTSVERQALATGHVPPAVGSLAAESLRQLRLVKACDALAHGHFSPDHERLVFSFWPSLGAWAKATPVELRSGGLNGPVLQRTNATATTVWTLVRRGHRYQAFNAQQLPLSGETTLEAALFSTLSDDVRAQAIGHVQGPEGLREALLERALADRDALRPMMGMVRDNRRFFRPPRRTEQGAVGYELSGRGRWLETLLGSGNPYRRALRALYPEVSDAELMVLQAELGDGEAATTRLAALNADLARLRLELDTWIAAAGPAIDAYAEAMVAYRRAAGQELVAAWQRRQSNYAYGGLGYGIDMRGMTVGQLPPLSVRFDHVERLAMVDMALTHLDEGFLANFPNVRQLDVSFNNLTALPQGLERLNRLERLNLSYNGQWTLPEVSQAIEALTPQLTHLDLSGTGLSLSEADFQRLGQFSNLRVLVLEDNAISLDERTANGFNALVQLQELILSGNSLGQPPVVSDLHSLAMLEVTNADLTAFPPGLQALMNRDPMQLREVNLNANAITELPDLTATRFITLAQAAEDDVASEYYGISLQLDGNPLNADSQDMLRRAGIPFFTAASDSDELAVNNDEWLVGCPEPLRARVETERATHEAAEFYQLLSRIVETADYHSDAAATRQRAWALVDLWLRPGEGTLPGLADLRERLFAMAQDTQGTCGDGVALTLDDMEFEAEAWQIVGNSRATGDGPLQELLTYQRGLFRRALVDERARRIVRARLARRAGLGGETPAPALDPLDDIADNHLDEGLDELEVRFYLFQRLEGPLELPPSRGMRYSTRVSGATAQRVGVEVHQSDTDAAFARWVAERPGFRTYLEHGRAEAFQTVRERWDAAASYLYDVSTDDGAEALPWPVALNGLRDALPEAAWPADATPTALPPLNEQQLRVAYGWVTQQRMRELNALALRLTQELLGLATTG